jgi:lipopolysaccharide export LptBFGC system permease protein LptF
MKFPQLLLSSILLSLVVSCGQTKDEYIDLTSGKTVRLEEDKQTGYLVNADTKKPVYIYINPSSEDTFYGRTGKKINGNVIKTSNGNYKYDGDNEYVYKDGDFKLKNDDDGDYKDKDGDRKVKVDEDGDLKIKDGDYKKKVDNDGDVKIKDGDKKVKIDKDGDRKVKVDD